MSNNDKLRLVAAQTMVKANIEATIRMLEIMYIEVSEQRAEVMASIEPAHIIDDLQLVVPL